MGEYDFDLFVIGAGSGGVRAARLAAMSGAKVAVAEEYRVGGTCVIRGCVPKKLMVYASHVHKEIEDAAGFGWNIPAATFDWPTFRAKKDKEIAKTQKEAEEFLANRDDTTAGGTSWERIAKLVDLSGKGAKGGASGSEKARFRDLLLTLKKDEKAPGATGY